MEYSVSLPVDNGFLRRECPHCQRQFKWHHGPTDSRPPDAVDPNIYSCPYCGETAALGDWWTREQIEYVQRRTSSGPLIRSLAEETKRSLSNIDLGSLLRIGFSVKHNEPEPPPALHEPHDMMLVESPCHPWEPIKLVEDWNAPIHCLVCGQAFSV